MGKFVIEQRGWVLEFYFKFLIVSILVDSHVDTIEKLSEFSRIGDNSGFISEFRTWSLPYQNRFKVKLVELSRI